MIEGEIQRSLGKERKKHRGGKPAAVIFADGLEVSFDQHDRQNDSENDSTAHPSLKKHAEFVTEKPRPNTIRAKAKCRCQNHRIPFALLRYAFHRTVSCDCGTSNASAWAKSAGAPPVCQKRTVSS